MGQTCRPTAKQTDENNDLSISLQEENVSKRVSMKSPKASSNKKKQRSKDIYSEYGLSGFLSTHSNSRSVGSTTGNSSLGSSSVPSWNEGSKEPKSREDMN